MSTNQCGNAQDAFYATGNIVPLPLIVRAEGIWMYDDVGRAYIDASSGPVVSNLGHGNARVIDAMATQARRLDFAYSRVSRHQSNIDLTHRISELAGPGYERVCLASGGSEAIEIAIKFLRQYVVAKHQLDKKRIITLSPSYHGGTIATLAITGDDTLDPFIDGFAMKSDRIPAPFQYRLPDGQTRQNYRLACAQALEDKILEIGAENILTFIVEPIGGLATGALVLSEDYVNRIRKICTQYGVYLIYDEVMCGTGRAGRFLASHAWPDARADVVVLAKGLGSGYTPLGAVMVPGTMADELAELTGFNFSHTYNANPISCATGIAVLEEYDRLNLIEAAAERGKSLKARLETLATKYPCMGDVRGAGLMMAVELVQNPDTKATFPASYPPTEHVRIFGLKHGLLLYSRRTAGGRYGDWFMVAPPLTITEDECDELVDRLDATLNDFSKAACTHLAEVIN